MNQRRRPTRRTGYTFIELLMVVVIIAILAALLLGGINKVMAMQARTEVLSDITQMAQSLEQAKAQYGHVEHLPSCLVLHNDKTKYRNASSDPRLNGLIPGRTNVSLRDATQRSMATLQAMFGRRLFQAKAPANGGELINWDGSGNLNNSTVLSGPECLVFYLGGMPDLTPNKPRCLGFSKDAQDPTGGTTDRIGPFFQFKPSRLVVRPGRAFFEYLDAYPNKTGFPRQPYAYFGAFGPNDYAPANVYRTNPTASSATFTNTDNEVLGFANAYFETGTSGSSTRWLHPNKYQIISAGPDRAFGAGGPLLVTEGSIDPLTKDNLANFSSSELSNPVE